MAVATETVRPAGRSAFDTLDPPEAEQNGDAIEALQRLRTPLKDGDEVTIIPAMAGGGG